MEKFGCEPGLEERHRLIFSRQPRREHVEDIFGSEYTTGGVVTLRRTFFETYAMRMLVGRAPVTVCTLLSDLVKGILCNCSLYEFVDPSAGGDSIS